ncbi:MAG: tRNA (guanosine(46)-N7)-methyltransferase TrmB [Clostridiales bacterium]|jgi:tRNA (guanine-N7-)-methyltransferase|nr:tRNA (guanosine(46)-N7)-methyltransferase TrmB [Clostridiales bacterium]
MRMRKKKNLPARIERVSDLHIKNPDELRGGWKAAFSGFTDIHIEIGCGKGRFTVETAAANPDILFIAIERVWEAMIVAMERAKELALENVFFIDMDAAEMENVFDSREVGRIYLNFCDPWPSRKHAKRRLTSPNFLLSYSKVLRPGGEVHFKTDNPGLFEYSADQFKNHGFELTEVSENLHENGVSTVLTDYEAKFIARGLPIFHIVARLKQEDTQNTASLKQDYAAP